MPNVCLPPKVVDKFTAALKSGKINPAALERLTSEERHKLFTDVVGEGNAKFVNSTFEAKLLLKNKQQGYLTWAKKLTGITPEAKRDMISRIERMDKILNPDEEKAFLHDLASTRLGIDVSVKEAKTLASMSEKVQQAQAKQRRDGTFASEADRIAYGRAKVAMGSYLAELKNHAAKYSTKEKIMHPIEMTTKGAGLAKSLKATLDNSAIFRQGWKTLWTNPRVWQRNARKSFIDIAKQLGGKDTLKEVSADIVSRPNYARYAKMKLAIGNIEEEFPSTLPEKVPLLGRAYKASEGAYTGFLYRQRADIADKLLDVAEKSGVDINDKAQLQAIGKMINALTGRGDLGRLEGTAANSINNVFFSGRFLKSNFDTLTAHQLQKGVTPFVRKQAALNLVKVVTGTAAVLTIANALMPGSVEFDPRSSRFGKIKVGKTTFDVTGGMGSIIVLATQLIKHETKSSTTGVVTKLGTGYGQTSGMDVVNNFFENKLSPAASVVKDLLNQADFNGNKPTVGNEAKNLFLPLPIQTQQDASNTPGAANKLLIAIADGLGIASSTNAPKRNTNNLSPTQQDFKQKIGDKRFTEANGEYDRKYNAWLDSHSKNLQQLPDDEKQSVITSAKSKIQATIYKQYGFKPPKAKSNKSLQRTKKTLLDSIR